MVKMFEVNLVFGNTYDDVDIISVPDFIYENLEDLKDEFEDLVYDQTGDWVCDTQKFVLWLNEQVKGEKVTVIKAHTLLNPRLKSVDFVCERTQKTAEVKTKSNGMFDVNVVFDTYDDVDIITVPDFIYDDLENFERLFLNQISAQKPGLGTYDFISWLNEYHAKDRKATIVQEHTFLNPKLKAVHF